MIDPFTASERRKREVLERDRRMLARAYGKPCGTCGNGGMVSDGKGGQKPCPKCKHRRGKR